MLVKQKKTKHATKIELIEDKNKRVNLKSKRTRTLFRKAIEVSKMCNLDIYILTKDRDSAKVVQYNSVGPLNNHHFTIDKVILELAKFKDMHVVRNFKHYTDLDYEALKQQPRLNDFGDHRHQLTPEVCVPPPVIAASTLQTVAELRIGRMGTLDY